MTIVYGDVNLKKVNINFVLFFLPFKCTLAETGGIAITPLPESERKPGFVMKPFFGVEPVLMNEKAGVLSAKTDRYIPYKFTRYITCI